VATGSPAKSRAPARTGKIMFWLVVLATVQLFGFGITLVRLTYDEWKQHRERIVMAELEDRQDQVELKLWKAAATM
jgi:hypothetical protein